MTSLKMERLGLIMEPMAGEANEVESSEPRSPR
jgi:hypothetical protein